MSVVDNKNRVKQTLWLSEEHSKCLRMLDEAFPEAADKPLSERIAFYNAFLLEVIKRIKN